MKKKILLLLILLAGCQEQSVEPLPGDASTFQVRKSVGDYAFEVDDQEILSGVNDAFEQAELVEGPVAGIGENFTISIQSENGEEQSYPVWLNEQSIMFEQEGR